MDYRHIITIEPDKMGGKPCIRGLRITVYDVLDYLASGMTEAEILADFPDLTAKIFAPLSRSPPTGSAGSSLSGVKLLLDESLSPTLVAILSEIYPATAHVRDFGLKSAPIRLSGPMLPEGATRL